MQLASSMHAATGSSSSSPATLQLLVGFALHALCSLLFALYRFPLNRWRTVYIRIIKEPALIWLCLYSTNKKLRVNQCNKSLAFAFLAAWQLACMQCKSQTRTIHPVCNVRTISMHPSHSTTAYSSQREERRIQASLAPSCVASCITQS